MQPRDLLETSNVLLKVARGKPTQANLRRSHSTAYYAMFHCLAGDCANLLLGEAVKTSPAWRQAYRALEHTKAKESCRNRQFIENFPSAIQDFANSFLTMQEKRHNADYDPFLKLTKSVVQNDVEIVKRVIDDFRSAKKSDRRAFCAYVLFKVRK